MSKVIKSGWWHGRQWSSNHTKISQDNRDCNCLMNKLNDWKTNALAKSSSAQRNNFKHFFDSNNEFVLVEEIESHTVVNPTAWQAASDANQINYSEQSIQAVHRTVAKSIKDEEDIFTPIHGETSEILATLLRDADFSVYLLCELVRINGISCDDAFDFSSINSPLGAALKLIPYVSSGYQLTEPRSAAHHTLQDVIIQLAEDCSGIFSCEQVDSARTLLDVFKKTISKIEANGYQWDASKLALKERLTNLPKVSKKNIVIINYKSFFLLLKNPLAAETFIGKLVEFEVISEADADTISRTEGAGKKLFELQKIFSFLTEEQICLMPKAINNLLKINSFNDTLKPLLENVNKEILNTLTGDFKKSYEQNVLNS